MHVSHRTRLSPDEVRFFHYNGFLKLPNRLSTDQVKRLRDVISHDIENEVEPVQRDAEGTVGRISNVMDRDPVFWESMTSPLVLDPLESLLGPNIVVLKNRHNHATLRRASDAGALKFHRDVREWTRTIITVLFYLEESTVEKGCTVVVPSSHMITESAYLDDTLERLLEQAVPVPMPAGGMLAINSMILHAVGRNVSGSTRMNMTVGYHSVDELATVEDPYRRLARGTLVTDGHLY